MGLILYPIAWLLLLPFRLVGIAFKSIAFLPARLLGQRPT